MTDQLKGNWRSLSDYRFLSSFDLEENQKIKLTIQKVTMEEAIDPSTKKTKALISLHFNETDRIMGLNKTNCKILTSNFKTPKMEKWVGKEIVIYKTTVYAFGEHQECIRIISDSKNVGMKGDK